MGGDCDVDWGFPDQFGPVHDVEIIIAIVAKGRHHPVVGHDILRADRMTGCAIGLIGEAVIVQGDADPVCPLGRGNGGIGCGLGREWRGAKGEEDEAGCEVRQDGFHVGRPVRGPGYT